MKKNFIYQVYKTLLIYWGEQHWWPAQNQFEMMVGAILTQNTNWKNVEKTLYNLKKHQALSIQSLKKIPHNKLAEWIRPAGYYNQKATYLKIMAKTISDRFNGSLDSLFSIQTNILRKELLSWKGIGPETADSILLYAANRPVFVVDSYTKRFLIRHHQCTTKTTYNAIAKLFENSLPKDVQLYNEYHALIVRLGKEYCQSKPICTKCPLKTFL